MSLALAPLTARHAPAIARLVEEALGGGRAPAALLMPGPGVRRRVLLDADGPVGWLEFRCVVDEAELLEIAVAPRARRRGHGRRLMHGLLAELAQTPATALHLEVRASNAPAQALYAAFGLSPVGRRRRYYADGEDAVLYHRRLSPDEEPR